MQIKDLAIGDGFVYLMEDDAKVKFYVLAHNYESGLNGRRCFAGRVQRRAGHILRLRKMITESIVTTRTPGTKTPM